MVAVQLLQRQRGCDHRRGEGGASAGDARVCAGGHVGVRRAVGHVAAVVGGGGKLVAAVDAGDGHDAADVGREHLGDVAANYTFLKSHSQDRSAVDVIRIKCYNVTAR